MSDKSKKAAHPALRKLGITLLILLLVIGCSVCLLYFSITKDTVTIDDPVALAAQKPMSASQRFVFDAGNESVQISLNKSDLWWLILPEMGENFLEDVNKELEKHQLSLTGYGLDITEDGVYIDVEATYQSIRIPVHILTDLEVDASGISVTLNKAKLGLISIPVKKLLSSVRVHIDIDWPVVTDIINVAYQQDAVLLTGTLTQDMLSCAQEGCSDDAIGWFSENHQAAFRAAREEDGYRTVLPGLETDPGSVESLYHELFTMAMEYEYDDFMTSSKNLAYRFFPEIDYDGLQQERDAYREQWAYYNSLVDKLVTDVSKDFNNRRFSLKNGEFYFRNTVFDVLSYFTNDTAVEMQQMFNIIDHEKFRLVIVGSINGYSVNSPILSSICGQNQQLTKELDRSKAYTVGCVFQGTNGQYFLRYESMKISGKNSQMSKWLKTVTLTETEYASLIQEGKIGVWVS